jgi:hypothetical protein
MYWKTTHRAERYSNNRAVTCRRDVYSIPVAERQDTTRILPTAVGVACWTVLACSTLHLVGPWRFTLNCRAALACMRKMQRPSRSHVIFVVAVVWPFVCVHVRHSTMVAIVTRWRNSTTVTCAMLLQRNLSKMCIGVQRLRNRKCSPRAIGTIGIGTPADSSPGLRCNLGR